MYHCINNEMSHIDGIFSLYLPPTEGETGTVTDTETETQTTTEGTRTGGPLDTVRVLLQTEVGEQLYVHVNNPILCHCNISMGYFMICYYLDMYDMKLFKKN